MAAFECVDGKWSCRLWVHDLETCNDGCGPCYSPCFHPEGDVSDDVPGTLFDDITEDLPSEDALAGDIHSGSDSGEALDVNGPDLEVSDDVTSESDVANPVPEDVEGDDASLEMNDIEEDASTSIDTSEQDVVTTEDDAKSEDDAKTEDATATDDAVADAAAGDDASGEGAASEDTAVEDAEEDAGPEPEPVDGVSEGDTALDEGVSCEPVGSWTFETMTAALPGEGCQPDGSPAQGPNTKTFIVTQNPDGSLMAVVPEVTEPVPVVTVTQLPELPCNFRFTLAVSVYFEGSGSEEPSTVYLTYTYLVALSGGGVSGSGTVYTATIFDSGEVQQECTEDISIGGSFTPTGP